MAEERQAGFTLVEMLVCLALAALIGTLMVNAVRVSGTASSAVARAVEAEEVQSVRDHLRRTLGSLARHRPEGARPALIGEPAAVSAVIAPDRSVERAAELIVTLAAVARGDGGYDLVARSAAAEAAPDALRGMVADAGPSEARAEILLEGVAGFAIRYFGAQARGARPGWHAAWAAPDRAPTLLEIEIAFAAADRRRWPPLLVALGDRP